MKARRGGVPKIRSSSSKPRSSHRQSIKPSTAAPESKLTDLEILENQYKTVYNQWKIERDGADEYGLGEKPKQLSEIQQKIVEILENQYETVYEQWKIENTEYRRSVDDYQRYGADGYGLGPKPESLRNLDEKLSEIQQKFDVYKPKPKPQRRDYVYEGW